MFENGHIVSGASFVGFIPRMIFRFLMRALFRRLFGRRRGLILSLAALILVVQMLPVQAATLPPTFTETLIASGLSSPTAMQFAPDGRLFVLLQGGQVRIIQNSILLPTPALTISVNSSGERGLLGLAFDPNFATNSYIYLYYTVPTAPIHNRVSRFMVSGNTINPSSEFPLIDLDNLSSATNHNGGAMHFGLDGKLYVAVGENANPAFAQSFANRHGKMLRYNTDGTIPTDNPFYGTATGANRSIWALGLRNPYTFAFHRTNGQMRINDVGAGTWEEVNPGIVGANYGWPNTEGYFNPSTYPNFTNPLYAYDHGGALPNGCAITGGTFYDPVTSQFPASYANDYFFADYCDSWVRVMDSATNNTVEFASSTDGLIVDLKVSTDGFLYWLARGSGGVVRRIGFGTTPPTITQNPANQNIGVGSSATFTCSASGTAPMSYQWQRNSINISGATGTSYTLNNVSVGDNGATFRCVATNAFGTATSIAATLTVINNQPPVPTITSPTSGGLYSGSETFTFSGTATDPEDGTLPASAYTWVVNFHHDTHDHPFVPPTSGVTNGMFTIPNSGETAVNVWYRVILTVTDSDGVSTTTSVDIFPRVVNVTINANVSGLSGTVDGSPVSLPNTFQSVVGILRSIGVSSPQTVSATTYTFTGWSNSGAQTQTITTPLTSTTYTANFAAPATQTPTPPAGLIVSRTSMTVNEGGMSVIYNVRLTTSPAPGETVTVIPQFDGGQLILSPVNRQLNNTNWNTGRNFTVTALDDTVAETSPLFTSLTHNTTSTLGGSPYSNLTGRGTISVTVIDNDSASPTATPTRTATPTSTGTIIPTITPSPTASATTPPASVSVIIVTRTSFSVTEGGISVTYNARLSSAPAFGETVTIIPQFDGAQLSFLPTSRQLSSSNWNTGRNFTVTAVNDTAVESSPLFTNVTHNTISTLPGSPYGSLTGSASIGVSVFDNDVVNSAPGDVPAAATPTFIPDVVHNLGGSVGDVPAATESP